MKKLISLAVLSIVPMIFTACGQKADKDSFVGYWQGEANTIFEVLTENGQDFIIRNIHGDLTAKIEDGELRGKNDKRISKDEYNKIFETLSKPAIQ